MKIISLKTQYWLEKQEAKFNKINKEIIFDKPICLNIIDNGNNFSIYF